MEPTNLSQLILDNESDPEKLESLYRQNPTAFQSGFDQAFQQHPSSIVLSVWQQRLKTESTPSTSRPLLVTKELLVAGCFAITAAVVTRIVLTLVLTDSISPFNLVLAIAGSTVGYFLYNSQPTRKMSATIIASLAAMIIFINLLPLNGSDVVFLANLHLPIAVWVLAGAAYTGDRYRQTKARLNFLKFNGEFTILFAILSISGILLTAITMRLFSLLGLDIAEFYFTNIVSTGAAFLVVIAAFMVINRYVLAKNMAPYIAKIFSPLVLVTLIAYLVTVAVIGNNPFLDRDFLLVFNVVLFGVLVVIIFSITERDEQDHRNFFDLVSIAMIILALATDLVALSAIVFRLSAYGLTPNRLAVLGANIAILVHLVWILWAFSLFLQKKQGVIILQQAATQYLPVYGAWALIVAVSFPLVFGWFH